jgi:two-component system NarL family sensor kinase
VEVTVDTSVVEDLPIELVAELLSIAREGLSNIARHASASRAVISLGNNGSRQLRLELSDDGRGFRADDAIAQGHHGLANMRVRTEALGGTFELSSGDGPGTRVIITLPPRSKAAEGDDQ